MPGLIDSHIHVALHGESQHYVNLASCKSIADIRTAFLCKLSMEPALPCLIGFGWDQETIGRMPTRQDFDDLFANMPVFLWRACWHIGVANTFCSS